MAIHYPQAIHDPQSARPGRADGLVAHGALVRISEGVLFRAVGDEAVLLDLQSSRYFGLDAVGTRIWLLLEECRRVSVVAHRLLAEYDTTADQVGCDLAVFLGALAERGLVEFDDGT